MELAILSCNNKLNNDTAFQIFAMYEYLKRQGNNVQVVDCGLKDYKKNYDFLSSNVVLTVNTYMDYRRFEENQPLVDKYIILNYDCDDENLHLNGKENIIYGINNIFKKQDNYTVYIELDHDKHKAYQQSITALNELKLIAKLHKIEMKIYNTECIYNLLM